MTTRPLKLPDRVERTLLSAAFDFAFEFDFDFAFDFAFEFDFAFDFDFDFATRRKSNSTPKSKAADRSVRPTLRREPKPGIIFCLGCQTLAHRVLANVFQLFLEASVASQHVVERLFLPDRARGSLQLVYATRRHPFDQLEDERQRVGPALIVRQGSEQEMHVIGHDDCGLEIDSLPVVIYAMRENQVARRVGKGIADEFAESHEDGTAGFLVMRHAAPITVFAGKDRRVGHNLSIQGANHGCCQ